MKDLINWANSISDPDKKKEAQEYVKEVMQNEANKECTELKQVNVDVKIGKEITYKAIPIIINGITVNVIHMVYDYGDNCWMKVEDLHSERKRMHLEYVKSLLYYHRDKNGEDAYRHKKNMEQFKDRVEVLDNLIVGLYKFNK